MEPEGTGGKGIIIATQSIGFYGETVISWAQFLPDLEIY